MYLKEISLKGFKSFADRSVLKLEQGINLIVGPNGSGKSNVSDAIRWALGEQSMKNLRSSKGEDVIFAGSKSKKALGMAEVCPTLDNSDQALAFPQHEVSVTRRVYRSGESEYLINQDIWRLRDILDLFNDVGIGKESLSIIGQGKIDEVLNAKPEDRRAIIEEAAGIVKYRNRKREAEKKISETKINLERLLDILIDVEARREPLAVEAEQAKIYLSLRKDFQSLDIELLLHEIAKSMETLQGIEEKITDRTTVIEQDKVKISSHISEIVELETAILIEEQSVAEWEQQYQQTKSDLARCELQNENAKQQQLLLQEQLNNYEKEKKELNLEQELATKEAESTLKTQETAAVSYNELAIEIASKELELSIGLQSVNELELTIEKINNNYFEQMHQETKLKNNIASYEAYLKNSNRIQEEIGSKKDRMLQALTEQQNKLAAVKAKVTELKEDVVKQEVEIQNIEQKKQTKIQAEQTLSASCTELTNLKAETENRLKLLQSLEKEHLGYHLSTKNLLQAREQKEVQLPGGYFAVGEVLRPAEDYIQAVEVALGFSVQNIVCATTDGAKSLITWLKERKKGRVTILPLDDIQPNTGLKNRMAKDEYLQQFKRVSEVTTCKAGYEKIKEYLLGNILLVSTLDEAIKVAKKYSYGFRIVTLEGDILSPGGSLTGGYEEKRKQDSLFARSNELEKLQLSLQEQEQAEKLIIQELLSIQQEKSMLEKTLELNRTNLQLAIQALTQVAEEEKYNEKTWQDFNIQLELLGLDRVEAERVKLENQEQLLLQQELLEKHKQAVILQQADLGEQQEALKRAKSNTSNISLCLNQKLQTEASLKERLSGMERETTRSSQRVQELYRKQQQIQDNISKIQSEISALADVSQEKTLEKEQLELHISDLTPQVEQHKALLEASKKQIHHLRDEKDAAQEQIEKQNSSLNSFMIQKAKQETEQLGKLERLEEKHRLSAEEALKVAKLTEQAVKKKAIRDELDQQLGSMGDVNVSAIEEYQQLEERYHFMKNQEKDLFSAIASLEQIIGDMEKVMLERFLATFTQVELAFGEIFAQLFHGGTAQIEITNPDDVLSSGIEIYAQPPGKMPKSLSLLSGGERALTAIALLFAILKANPSPFCVVDEIDASLDEMNVSRFANFIRQYCKYTQFIIISHRQSTIEAADTIYGVTIEKSGISKLVSVKLNEI